MKLPFLSWLHDETNFHPEFFFDEIMMHSSQYEEGRNRDSQFAIISVWKNNQCAALPSYCSSITTDSLECRMQTFGAFTSKVDGKGKGSCLESITTHVQQTLPFPWQGGHQFSLQLLIQPWICTPGTHYGWVDQGSVEYDVCTDTSTHGQHWESNPTPSDLESNALSTGPHAPMCNHLGLLGWNKYKYEYY